MKKLSFSAQQLLETMQNGVDIVYRYLADEAYYDDSSRRISVSPVALEELKRAKLIQIKSYDKNVLWITFEAIKKNK